ncbi:zinc finger domain-containing protein [Venturia nashicola]|uniref:Zinc finger domain-containing protein n=1 Tax=Venturia nashicola TaxID=86259 RepID=A0A4Z1PLS8_9PEZI|nr:zinc finger domain-containing protein [Venturia nashicola]
MSDTPCGVCKTSSSKYKCPHCQLPYCSVKCFKTHILTHESDNKPSSPTEQSPVIVDTGGENPHASGENESDPDNPYEALLQHAQFHNLFTRYSLLKAQLARVYNATKNPSDIPSEERVDQQGNGYGRGSNHQQCDRVKGQWTQEKANELAAEILMSLMKQEEGVRELMALRRIVFEAVEKSNEVVVGEDVDVDVSLDVNGVSGKEMEGN